MSLVNELHEEAEKYGGNITSIWMHPDLIEKLGKEAPDKVMQWFPSEEWTYNGIPLIPMASTNKWVLIFDRTNTGG